MGGRDLSSHIFPPPRPCTQPPRFAAIPRRCSHRRPPVASAESPKHRPPYSPLRLSRWCLPSPESFPRAAASSPIPSPIQGHFQTRRARFLRKMEPSAQGELVDRPSWNCSWPELRVVASSRRAIPSGGFVVYSTDDRLEC
jgi:hypothetical protein